VPIDRATVVLETTVHREEVDTYIHHHEHHTN